MAPSGFLVNMFRRLYGVSLVGQLVMILHLHAGETHCSGCSWLRCSCMRNGSGAGFARRLEVLGWHAVMPHTGCKQ
jgi:hypothetical protein